MMKPLISEPSAANDYQAHHAALLLSSYHRLTGKNLIDPGLVGVDAFRALYHAPYGVVSHNTEAEPIFNYGNKAALRLFEMPWQDFIALPSKESAEPANRKERARLLARVHADGFIDNYRGIRISASGNRFWIEKVTIWHVVNPKGDYCGQAAVFYQWKPVWPHADKNVSSHRLKLSQNLDKI